MTTLISRLLTTALLLGVLILAARAEANAAPPWGNWRNSLLAEHALVGKIWSARDKRFVTPAQLAADLADAKYVMIGETHDNADHHRLQAWLIDRIAATRKPAVVMEMIPLDQADKLAAYMARSGANASGLGPSLGWANSGWPAWPLYQPIAEAVFRSALQLFAGDPRRADIRSIAKQGVGALARPEQQRLALDKPLSPALGAALSEDIRLSHCDLLPDKALGPMELVQRYRDAVMASALIRAAGGGSAILIAGNGHARADRGVPWYLARRDAGAKTSSVLLVEMTGEARTIADLAITGPDGAPAADYFWITPRAEREDQCEKLRQRFKNRRPAPAGKPTTN